jgi:putative nucleotidyltransferase with HDIG domain
MRSPDRHDRTDSRPGDAEGGLFDRDRVLALLHEYTEGPGLRKHAYGVEAAMRAYARRHGEDEALWGAAGLLHDMDYEKHPSREEHPFLGCRILEAKGYPEGLIEAILGHATYSGVPRTSLLAKTLFAVDELSGLITATALVMPSKRLADVTTESVIKKMRTKGFARSVNREEIEQGAADLGVPLEEHVTFVLTAMQGAADRLGL